MQFSQQLDCHYIQTVIIIMQIDAVQNSTCTYTREM